MFDVAKVIRAIGYWVYTILWSPVILAIAMCMVIINIIYGLVKRDMAETKSLFKTQLAGAKAGIKHDMNFIQTGEW